MTARTILIRAIMDHYDFERQGGFEGGCRESPTLKKDSKVQLICSKMSLNKSTVSRIENKVICVVPRILQNV